MAGYNLSIEVNDEEYATALRLDDSVDHLEAMKRAFWAVKNEFYPEDKNTIREKYSFKAVLQGIKHLKSLVPLLNKYKDLLEEYDISDSVVDEVLMKDRVSRVDSAIFTIESWVTYTIAKLEITDDELDAS